jgi:thiol-disulfide isomerase/thioredoxin
MFPDNIHLCLIAGVFVLLVVIFFLISKSPSTQGYAPPSQSQPPQEAQEGPKQDESPLMVLFFSETCGHCKAMMPAWIEAESTLNSQGVPCQALEGKSINPKRFGISGYPDVRFFPRGMNHPEDSVKYQGDRTTKSLVGFGHNEMRKIRN